MAALFLLLRQLDEIFIVQDEGRAKIKPLTRTFGN